VIPRQVKWPDQQSRSYVSPFQRGAHERNLRITLHSEALQQLEAEEQHALAALRDLATLPSIDMVETGGGAYPRLILDPESENWDAHEAAIWRGNDIIRYGSFRVDAKSEFPNWVDELARFDQPGWVGLQSVRDELLSGIAHMAVKQDLFVTTSPRLLALRDNRGLFQQYEHIAGINPRLPSEAMKLAALFQRSRDEYRAREFEENKFPHITVQRGDFYRAVAYDRVPEAWRFESACRRARRSDDTSALAESVLQRCIRALEARDALGVLFYTPNTDNIADRVLYHFDYLNLILLGIFDALGRIARRTYGITSGSERDAGLHTKGFQDKLLQGGAVALHRLLTMSPLRELLSIIVSLCNTIHKAATEGLRVPSVENLNIGFVEVPDSEAISVWSEFVKLGDSTTWGAQQSFLIPSTISNSFKLHIEPYRYAVKVVSECLHYANQLMIAIDATRLLPPGFDHSQLRIGPQDNEYFPLKLREAITYLDR
jgi:hypothetical protein